jgi:formate C-acetyltransferase
MMKIEPIDFNGFPVPVRLSAITHELADRALSGEHGRSMGPAGFRQYLTSYRPSDPTTLPLGGENLLRLYIEATPDYATTPLTVEMWVLLGQSAQYQVPISRGTKGPGHWELYTLPETGGLGCYTPDLNAGDGQTDIVLTDGQWHLLGWTLDGSNCRLYVDGNLIFTQSRVGTFAVAPQPIVVGELVEGMFQCGGAFRGLRISNITRNLSGQTGPLELDAQTVSLWRVEDMQNGVIPDRGTAGHPAYLIGIDRVLSADLYYAQTCKLVAEKAPLRILSFEKIVGSATLIEGASHSTPVSRSGSTSHITIGFEKGLKIGYRGLREQIDARLAEVNLPAGEADFLTSARICLDAAGIWHQRYMDLLQERADQTTGEEKENYLQVRQHLANVPENPPTNFYEAVQSLWFMYAFQRLMGNWPGIGRIDEMLGPWLQKDLDEGLLDLNEAREILAHFWIHGCEWIGAFAGRGSGDAQHYQNIILSGVDRDGVEVTNDVTYLVLEIVEELHISDFPIAVRINSNSPQKLLETIARVQRHGGGIVALYNEEVVIQGMVDFGYSLEEARCFTNDGCWEILIPGKSTFSYSPFDTLTFLHQVLGLHETAKDLDNPLDVGTTDKESFPDYPTFDSLYQAYLVRLSQHLDWFHSAADGAWANGQAAPLLSLLVEDCIARGRGYYNRGAHYNVLAPHAGGLANTANSLLVIKTLVYDEQHLTLSEFIHILRNNWEGQVSLRQEITTRFEFYGNDSAVADGMMEKVFNDYTWIASQTRERNGVLRPPGISTFGREIEWVYSGGRKASPDGHLEGEFLATNCSPSPGSDHKGPTAVINSYCRLDFTKTPNCATVELKVHPDSIRGERGIQALVGLMKTFVHEKGMFVHIDVVDSEMLVDAQNHPEQYPNLAVRIAGWSARFATLNTDWQNMIIKRTQQFVKATGGSLLRLF